MPTDDQNGRPLPQVDPAKAAASSQPAQPIPAAAKRLKPLDLSLGTAKPKNIVSARIDIRYDGSVGNSSILAANAVIEIARKCGLQSPLPAALELYPEPDRVLRGVPKDERNSAWLNLDWYDQGRRFRANFRQVLALLKITIPHGTRMVINLAADQEEELGPCLKLWWEDDCFVPIDHPDEE